MNNTFKYDSHVEIDQRESQLHHNFYYDCFNINMSPLNLFYLCHFKYPLTFLFRAPLVCSEIKEYSVKFKLKGIDDKKEENKPFVSKFMQKRQQFFNLLSMGGILECKLNEIIDEYKKIEGMNSSNLHLESIQEVQTCSSVSQKDFSSPFTMFFLLDQKLDLGTDNKDKEDEKEEEKVVELTKEEEEKATKLQEENQEMEDYVVDLYLQLYQSKPIATLLADNGYEPLKYEEEEEEKQPLKSKKKKSKKAKEEAQKVDEEELKKEKEKEKEKNVEKERIEKENIKQMRNILRDIHEKERQIHSDRIQELWDQITSLLLKQLHQCREVQDNENDTDSTRILSHNIKYVWKIFNRLIEDSMAVKFAAFHNSEKNKEFSIKAIKFAEVCLQDIETSPVTEKNSYEWIWLEHFFNYFQIVTTQSLDDVKDLDFTKKVLPTYMKVIKIVTNVLQISEDKKIDKDPEAEDKSVTLQIPTQDFGFDDYKEPVEASGRQRRGRRREQQVDNSAQKYLSKLAIESVFAQASLNVIRLC